MSRLMPTTAWSALALFMAIAAWWLANVSLLASSGFAAVPMLSEQAIYAVVLGQWLLIALFSGRDDSQGATQSTVANLNFVVPLWPLLALLWLTSKISIMTLVQTQAIAIALMAVSLFLQAGFSRLPISHENRRLLRSAAGIIIAALIYLGHEQLHTWVTR